jgi:hypothetical protein
MNEKRVTGLINTTIMNKTQKNFPEETIALLATTNFMRRITTVAHKTLPIFDEQPSLRAVMELFCRNRELAHFSIVCMLNAGYSETKILSRVAFENISLMRLFAIKPEVAITWFSDPDKFRKEWKPQKIRKAVFSKIPKHLAGYDNFYWLLCDYTHPSFKGWFEIFKRQENRVSIGARPEFNSEYASECIGLIGFIALQSIEVYSRFFQNWLDESIIKEADTLKLKVLDIVRRHFEIRAYDKKGLLRRQK